MFLRWVYSCRLSTNDLKQKLLAREAPSAT